MELAENEKDNKETSRLKSKTCHEMMALNFVKVDLITFFHNHMYYICHGL